MSCLTPPPISTFMVNYPFPFCRSFLSVYRGRSVHPPRYLARRLSMEQNRADSDSLGLPTQCYLCVMSVLLLTSVVSTFNLYLSFVRENPVRSSTFTRRLICSLLVFLRVNEWVMFYRINELLVLKIVWIYRIYIYSCTVLFPLRILTIIKLKIIVDKKLKPK